MSDHRDSVPWVSDDLIADFVSKQLHADLTALIGAGRKDGKRPEVVAHAVLTRIERDDRIERAYEVLDDAFGHADAPYTPAALEALAILRGDA